MIWVSDADNGGVYACVGSENIGEISAKFCHKYKAAVKINC